jgi:anti-anti-sigma regulatory factor
MLRTRRTGNGQALFTLSGRIETAEDIQQLEQMLAVETSAQQLILDLRDVTLVNQAAVKFLRSCEADGSSSKIADSVSEGGSIK